CHIVRVLFVDVLIFCNPAKKLMRAYSASIYSPFLLRPGYVTDFCIQKRMKLIQESTNLWAIAMENSVI
ncbi:hypothetical protein EJQ58_24725, partial [Salmonella enterica]|nr:hypothetical protein [Salmonella enterica]